MEISVFPTWQKKPEAWFELWPRNPIRAFSTSEAKVLVEPLRPGLEDGSLDSEFEKRPYHPPVAPELIKDIEHTARIAKARIVQYPDGIYSVGYLVYAPNGRYMPASTPSISAELEWEWGVTRMQDEHGHELRTLADNLESAEQIAAEELDIIVSKDPEIKPR